MIINLLTSKFDIQRFLPPKTFRRANKDYFYWPRVRQHNMTPDIGLTDENIMMAQKEKKNPKKERESLLNYLITFEHFEILG